MTARRLDARASRGAVTAPASGIATGSGSSDDRAAMVIRAVP